MSTRILLVDDDPNVLAAYLRTVRKLYDVDIATGGQAALTAFETKGPYAVVVTDMRMPGMTGLQLLMEIMRRSPDTVRIMLTGAEDQRTAVDAVNSSRVFRFLAKPCSPDEFLSALREGTEHYQFVRREREWLEQTFNGVVQMLTGVLAAVEPESFGLGQRLRDRARVIGEAMNIPSMWELEAAAMLLRVGIVTVPGAVLTKLRTQQPLTESEAEMIARIPEVGARLLEQIPRMAPVAEIIRYQGRGFDGSGTPAEGPKGNDIPLGSRILRALVEVQAMEDRGVPVKLAVGHLRQNWHVYDVQVLERIETLLGDLAAEAPRARDFRSVLELQAGMVLADDALSDLGLPLIKAGTRLSLILLERLRNFAELGQVQEPIYIHPPALNDTENPLPEPAAAEAQS